MPIVNMLFRGMSCLCVGGAVVEYLIESYLKTPSSTLYSEDNGRS